ncbi:glycoside hydrolase family 88 protein [Saccharicrinis sp. FJH62]|uniref:glycoside hydrolase family 88 protein n=1 Tax=Saccharicrinis sp. FJH62 TaxID=3344657 RepID=UPI0035D462AA
MRKINHKTLFIMLSLGITACHVAVEKPEKRVFNVDKAIQHAVDKVKLSETILSDTNRMPRTIETGNKEWKLASIHDWTSGFWPGILWYSFEATGDSTILKDAEKSTEALSGVLDVPVADHDLGFMLYCSYGNGERLIHKPGYKKCIIRAADSLATLYNPTVGTILSWPAMVQKMNWPHNTIIDNMMNLELLFQATKYGGSPNLYNIAVKHAETTLKHHIRPDYTTYHVAVYDTVNGGFIKGVTHQGYSDSSMWARGQAWGIYGFTMCYRETGKPEFLETAEKLAEVYLRRLPNDMIPYWDFEDPDIPDAPKDASSAAIVASALLELSGFEKNDTLAARYKNAAVDMLAELSSHMYQAPSDMPCILIHSTGNKPNYSEIDVPLIYADYYYLEALLRLKNIMLENPV